MREALVTKTPLHCRGTTGLGIDARDIFDHQNNAHAITK